ncbi:bifunctional pyr operon transcriptional regulator/uracil phosphoribosyltransferase PyrR [Ruminococcus sp.]|uniref:bifunctional pyr operon transcriptional regulator/uracil phosphoribosyltransferase PyrR n=1 Tax=Ruminococcus sp. TaxID=41978 RepID=UPI0025F2E64E|nr:bifunctional pyr operon transcriptional regulator/uracil phosphoribosyltransferase PyrR [Ruminococcus sp.]
MEKKAMIMDENAMRRAVARITYEILERNRGAEGLCIVGILSRGVVLAERIARKIYELEQVQVEFGALDITPYRDDRTADPSHCARSTIDFPVQDKRVVIVDDVLYTGRSCRAAIDAILAIGRPQCMQLAVLVDRGHRELPIRPDYIGKNVPTAQTETVRVSVTEIDGTDCVEIYQNSPEEDTP